MKNMTEQQLIKKLIEERDLAIKQLESIGVGLGDNMDHVKKALEQRLIPCSERLPEETGKYLLQCKQKVTDETYFTVAHINVWSETHKTWLVDGIPVAWMPLPEPYKDGE